MDKTETLVALVDGSVYAESVCDHAAWAAARSGLQVELLHVLGRRAAGQAPADLSGNMGVDDRNALLHELSVLDEQVAKLSQKRGRAILADARARLEAAGVSVVAPRLRFGDLLEAVAELEPHAAMIVIGKRGEAADFARLHLGSNLERVARASRRPVFVAARAFRPIRRFLIAYDGGASSMKAVDHVARDPVFEGLQCRLLCVGTDTPATRRSLEDACALLRAGGHEVTADILPGQPDKAIAAAVEEEGIDLLVMGAYGHSRVRQLIIGSTTAEMIRLCKIPILLFR